MKLGAENSGAELKVEVSAWSRMLAVLSASLILFACSSHQDDVQVVQNGVDDTEIIQQAVDRGGLVKFAPRTYYVSKTIVIRHSNTVLEGAGPQTVFQYKASAIRDHCVNERVFTTPCEVNDTLPRQIANAISIGDRSLFAANDVSDLQPGDWLIVKDLDSVIGNAVTVDWAQVDSVSGLEVRLRMPFRTAFTTAREWVPGKSGLGFQRVVTLTENTEFRNFNIVIPDAGPNTAAVGISVFAALHTTIDHVIADSFNAQPFYSFLSKDLTITNSEGRGHGVLSEFAATVDLTLHSNHFSEDNAAAMGLDLGAAFFDVSNNDIDLSRNIGAYLLYGVHDGIFSDNRIAYVNSNVNAVGILAEGAQNISLANNYLAGGDGPQSTGIVIQGSTGEIPIPSISVTLSGNTFGSGWVVDYQ